MFELRDRDGFARRGRLETPHGTLETPALLPVVHPDPARQTIPAKELRERFGFGAVITSSYILWRNAPLRERAKEQGLHKLLGYPGAVMTDSGAFQQHAYGEVEVEPEGILRFQGEIGSDIATVLDRFVEPEAPYPEAEQGVESTLTRAREARAQRGSALLAVPVQGGLFPDLRARSAQGASGIGDVLAVGGIVPLMERYRFGELAQVLSATRPALAPERPVHLFGLGHPMLFGLGAYFGADLFDSSSYAKFAQRETLLFPEGSLLLEEVQEEICGCAMCHERPLPQLRDLPSEQRIPWVARHNLAQCALEMARVRQAIRDGELRDLVERRSISHPAMAAALTVADRGPEVFLPVEPPSRRSFHVLLPQSLSRPSAVRFQRRLHLWRDGGPTLGTTPRRPLSPEAFRNAPLLPPGADPSGGTWDVATPLGPVPLELSEIYPVGPLLEPGSYLPPDPRPPKGPPRTQEDRGTESAPAPPSPPAPGEEERARSAEGWVRRHVGAILAWTWGWACANRILELRPEPVHSRSTRRLRQLRVDGAVLFVVGNDGLPRPTFAGGEALRRVLPSPLSRVVAQRDAVPFVSEGRSLFSRHVQASDPQLPPDASVLVVDGEDHLLAVGRTLLAGGELGRFQRGVAVRVTSHARAPAPPLEEESEGP